MHAARFGIDYGLEGVGVGRLELRELAPFENQPRTLDPFGGQSLKLVYVGGIVAALAFSPALQSEPVVEHLAQLLWRANRERAAGSLIDLFFERLDVATKVRRQTSEILTVNLDSAALHARDDRY